MLLLVHSFFLAIVGIADASVTGYGPHAQQPYATPTAPSVSYPSAASYDDVLSIPPPLPNPPPPTSFGVQLQTGAVTGLSMPHQDSFFGSSIELNVATQVLDLKMNGANEFTPGYAIYENGQPTRVALINFVSDDSGASDYTASVSVGGTVPSQVRVKYLSASSVTQKYNITWAGQIPSDALKSDGRPDGVVDVQNVACDETNNVCNVKVPAPGAALVFLSDQALAESDQGSTMTSPTTALHNAAMVDPAALATSDGKKGIADSLAGMSQNKGINAAFGFARALPGVSARALIAVCTFVCLESLLSYAVTGNSLLGLVSDMSKNA